MDNARRAWTPGSRDLGLQPRAAKHLEGRLRVFAPCGRDGAVGDDIEIVLDGVRRAASVSRAVALGARAVMIGRAYLWGLAANGQAGVETYWISCAAGSTRR